VIRECGFIATIKLYLYLPTNSIGHENADDSGEEEVNSLSDTQLSNIVDQVLNYDANRDGYISFGEFRNAQAASSDSQKKEKECRTCRG
jgi:hypothetical protein